MNNKGFTTVELIVAIAIAGIIMGAIGSFLTFNLRSFNTTKDIIDVQYESQIAMNQLTNILRESRGIESITDSTGDVMDLIDTTVTPVTMTFSNYEYNTVTLADDQELYTLTYDTVNNQLSMNVSGTDYIVAELITSFEVKPLNGSFRTSNGISLTMIVTDRDADIDVSTQVQYRNKR